MMLLKASRPDYRPKSVKNNARKDKDKYKEKYENSRDCLCLTIIIYIYINNAY